MSNQNNRNYSNSNDYRGRRYRDDDRTAYGSSIDNFDVSDGPSYPRQQRVQDYNRHQQVRGNPQRDYGVRGQGYNPARCQPQGYYDEQPAYDNRRHQPYAQDYDEYYGRNDGYGDSYDVSSGYGQRRVQREYYDDRYDRRNTAPGQNYYNSRSAKPPKKRSSPAIVVVRVIAILMLFVGAGIIGYKLYEYYDAGKGHRELSALSHDLEALYAKNNDFFGWLQIADTNVDYPVMHTPYEPEKYLHEDFDNDYSESGELFMDANCDPNGYHYLIYGHHMFNGSMLGSLPKYGDESYFNEHRTIRFDTRFEKAEYEVFAVFYSQIYDEDEDVFKYYECANLNDEGTYNYYVQNVKALSIYDTGVTPTYGETIVTLSTCNYHTEDGRFVVAARKIQ